MHRPYKPSYLEAPMGSAFFSRIPLRQKGIGPPTRWVLLIALLAALPGAHADVVPDWNLTTAQTLAGSQGWDWPGSEPGPCDGARRDI